MVFQKGNTHGKGRPQGSQNKLTSMSKDFLKAVLFNEEEFLNDYKELDLNGRMELRIKLAPFLLPKAKEVEEQYKDGPLFIDEPIGAQIYKEFGLDPNLLEDPNKFNFDEWGKHMKEKAEKEIK